jgi:DNA-binding transcriptional MerR regulator
MKQYYKIGEISEIYEIGKDSLIYYEELGIIKPSMGENGYRLYNIKDVWKLNGTRGQVP